MEGVFRLTDQEIDAIASRVLEKMKSSHSLQSIDGGGKMVADEPAKEPSPAWEPKVGDWVRVARPENSGEVAGWIPYMDQCDGKVLQVIDISAGVCVLEGFYGLIFYRSWLSPAEPPKPAKPEYRKPVLPADLGKWAEFSQDGSVWYRWKLCGCYRGAHDRAISWTAENAASIGFRHCRIKKDA